MYIDSKIIKQLFITKNIKSTPCFMKLTTLVVLTIFTPLSQMFFDTIFFNYYCYYDYQYYLLLLLFLLLLLLLLLLSLLLLLLSLLLLLLLLFFSQVCRSCLILDMYSPADTCYFHVIFFSFYYVLSLAGLVQPYHQRLREYRFYVNIGRGVNIGCDRCFYIMLLITSCIAFNN